MQANCEQLVNEIKRLTTQQNFRLAYLQWQDLQAQVQNGLICDVDLIELRQAIEDGRRPLLAEIKKELEQLTDRQTIDNNTFDLDAAQHTIDRFSAATLRNDDPDVVYFQNRVAQRQQEYEHKQVYERTKRDVEEQWAQAKQLEQNDENVLPETLLPFYKRALDIAERAQSSSPNNDLLGALYRRTDTLRERFANERNAMTSGVQRDLFLETFQHIDSVSEGDTILMFDYTGAPSRRLPKAEASRQTEDLTRTRVRKYLGEYIEEAKNALNRFEPRTATAALAKYDKFRVLENRVPELLDGALRRDLLKAENDIADARRLLEEVESKAREAALMAASDPLNAWLEFERVRSLYKGADLSEEVRAARSAILAAILASLRKAAEAADSDIRQGKFPAVRDYTKRLLDSFGNIEDIKFSEPYRKIGELNAEAQGNEEKRKQLIQRLDVIERMTNARQAQGELFKLANDFDSLLFEVEPSGSQYKRINSLIGARLNVSQAIEDLSHTLNSRSVLEVDTGIRTAEQLATEHGIKEFRDLTLQLRIYKEILEAEGQARVNMGDGIKALEDLLQRPDIPTEDLRKRIQTSLKDQRAIRERMSANRAHLSDAQKSLADSSLDFDKQVSNAWTELLQIRSLVDDTERQQWIVIARNSLRKLTIETPFDKNLLEQVLNQLEVLDQEQGQIQRERVDICLKAQEARDRVSANQYENALSLCRSLVSQTGGSDKAYVQRQVSLVSSLRNMQEHDSLLGQAAQVSRDETSRDLWTGKLEKFAEELRNEYRESDPNTAAYILWAVESDITRAQHEILNNIRLAAGIFKTLEDDTDRLEASRGQLLLIPYPEQRRKKLREDAPRYLKLVQEGAEIGQALEQVYQYMTVRGNIDDFADAYDKWREHVEPQLELLPRLKTWFDTIKTALITELRAMIKPGSSELALENLVYRAKLLILNPQDDTLLLREMARMTRSIDTNFRQLERGFWTGSSFDSGSNSIDLLKNTLDRLQYEYDYLRIIVQIARHFPEEAGELEGDQNTLLIDNGHEKIDHYDKMIQALYKFQKISNDFADFLSGVALNSNNRETFEEIIDAEWNEYREKVQIIDDNLNQALNLNTRGDAQTLTEHPRYKELDEARKIKLLNLLQLEASLKKIEHDALSESFEEALQEQNDLTRNPTLFPILLKSVMYSEFTIKDSGVSGWEEVRIWLTQKIQAYNRLVDWIEKLGIMPRNDTEPIALKSVLDWKQQKAEIKTLLDEGKFGDRADETGEAQRRVHNALDGKALPVGINFGLQPALEHARCPPLADTEDLRTTNYEEAKRHAGSKRAQLLLGKMETAKDNIQADVTNAEEMLRTIETTKQDWLKTVSNFSNVLAHASTLAAQRKLSKDECAELKEDVRQLKATLERLGSLCGQHPRLNILRRQPAFDLVKQRAEKEKC